MYTVTYNTTNPDSASLLTEASLLTRDIHAIHVVRRGDEYYFHNDTSSLDEPVAIIPERYVIDIIDQERNQKIVSETVKS